MFANFTNNCPEYTFQEYIQRILFDILLLCDAK